VAVGSAGRYPRTSRPLQRRSRECRSPGRPLSKGRRAMGKGNKPHKKEVKKPKKDKKDKKAK